MITIPASNAGAANVPESPIPANATLVIFDGASNAYTVYEQGDELPPLPDTQQ